VLEECPRGRDPPNALLGDLDEEGFLFLNPLSIRHTNRLLGFRNAIA
jgi:hypothetical protein